MRSTAMSSALGVFVAFALVSVSAIPAQAQQTAAYTNTLDDSADVSGWNSYGYPDYWNVDSSPIGGHSGAGSLNINNGTDIDNYNYWFYGYFDIDSSQLNLTGLTSPTLSFWCRWDLPTFADYQQRYISMYDQNDYDPYLQYYFDTDLVCGDANEWHQHTLALDPAFDGSTFIIEFYIYYDWWSSQSSASGYQGWFIDDIQILVADVTPPAAVSNVAAANATLNSVDVSWSSPTDDDVSGVCASFDLRFATTPITDSTFDNATAVTGEPAPDVAGTQHSMTLANLTQATTYYFALKTTDIAGNVSAISNVPTLATLTPPPPPIPPGPATTPFVEHKIDTILPCAAGTSASPTGLMVLAGLIALAAAVRMLKK